MRLSRPGERLAIGAVEQPTSAQHRYATIDLLRAIVMVLMVLDHPRDFFTAGDIDPRNVDAPLLFMTRWVTHFCAPVFAFLLGASAWFAKRKFPDVRLAARSMFMRGIWLILLELTIVRFAWTFEIAFNFILLQVLWALGCGLIFVSFLIAWPAWLVGSIGAGIILTHNLLDPIQATSLGHAAWLWHVLHEPQLFQIGSGRQIWLLYPLIPWIGVTAFGFGFAPNLVPGARRDPFFYAWGASMIGLFVLLRLTGVYGDPHEWQPQATLLASTLAFVNCEKYPPSLQFLLMTLGPTLACYPLLSRLDPRRVAPLLVFGKVPLFFYLLHIPLVHGSAIALAAWHHQPVQWLLGGFPLLQKPADYGLPLVSVYFIWLFIVILLYPLCRLYQSFKAQHQGWWRLLL
jgi:uncharacterized membrane protein